jgi:hypothetical protein
VFTLMTASMSYEDPILRQNAGTAQRARDILRDTGKSMWTSGKSFGKIGALYASIECVIESVSCICMPCFYPGLRKKKVSRQNRHLQLGWRRLSVWRCTGKSLRPKSCFWRRFGVRCILRCD